MEFEDYTRAFVMVGKYAGEWKEVLLAEDGSMYALLQGMTPDDELRTVRLDNEGRLSAFIIDSVDAWNRMLTIGNAELVARLGSPVVYDRRGQVIFMETFEHGRAAWEDCLGGDDAAVALSPESVARGGYSIKLTTDSGDDHYAGISCLCGLLPVGRMGVAVSFAPVQAFTTFELRLTVETVAEFWEGKMRFDYDNDVLDVYTSADLWEEVGPAEIATVGSRNYNTMKMVIDIDDGYFERVMLNEYEYPITDKALKAGEPVGGRWAQMEVRFNGRADENDLCYVDNAILTSAEPVN